MAQAEVAVIARRRQFTLEQKQAYLDEGERSTLAAVSRRHGISRSLLQRWKETIGSVPRTDTPFVKLLSGPTESSTSGVHGPGSVFLHVDASIVIELPATADPQQIAALVLALRR